MKVVTAVADGDLKQNLIGIWIALGIFLIVRALLTRQGRPALRAVLWMGVGVGALLVFARVDYRKWRKLGAPLVVVTLGLLLGGISGYFGGIVDSVVMRTTELLLSIPSLYLIIALLYPEKF